jgi:DNA-binding NarL/FixJ family response regulator
MSLSEAREPSSAPSRAWLLVDRQPDEAWLRRATPLWLLSVTPDELSSVMGERPSVPPLTDDEEELLPLVAAGLGTSEIATRIRVSPRTAERRLARLRHRWNVSTTAELAALLARRGFGLAAGGHAVTEGNEP